MFSPKKICSITLLTTHLSPRTNADLLILLQLVPSVGPFEASVRLTPGAAGQPGLPFVLGLASHTGGSFHDKASLTPKPHDFI